MSGPIRLLKSQDRFLFSRSKYVGYIGGVGSGKTYAGCLKAILRATPGQDGAVIAPTYVMMRDVTQRTFKELLDASQVPYSFVKSEERFVLNGANVFFRSADTPDRLRGLNLAWAYLDEAAMMREAVAN